MVELKNRMRIAGTFHVRCTGPDGRLKWEESAPNLVVNAGLDYALDASLSGGSQITAWYLGLKNAGSPAAEDTMASHSGWTENTNYDETDRPAWSEGGVSSQSISNSGSPAAFSINADGQTIAGCFLTSDDTKGGTTGTLFSAANFASPKGVDEGDTLTVTYTVNAADDGA